MRQNFLEANNAQWVEGKVLRPFVRVTFDVNARPGCYTFASRETKLKKSSLITGISLSLFSEKKKQQQNTCACATNEWRRGGNTDEVDDSWVFVSRNTAPRNDIFFSILIGID